MRLSMGRFFFCLNTISTLGQKQQLPLSAQSKPTLWRRNGHQSSPADPVPSTVASLAGVGCDRLSSQGTAFPR